MISKQDYTVMRSIALSSDPLSSISSDTLYNIDGIISLRNQLAIRKLKKDSKKIENLNEYIIKRVDNGDLLYDIANELNFTYYKIAKTYLESIKIYNSNTEQITINKFLDNPTIITNTIIRNDILKCLLNDNICSVENNLISECYGKQYECILYEKLTYLHINYETEDDLRAQGRSKTPDVLLTLPMLTIPIHTILHTTPTTTTTTPTTDTTNNSTTHNNATIHSTPTTHTTPHTTTTTTTHNNIQVTDLCLVNWIDSKAMFADETTFREHIIQYKAYNNRYGKGLVIYWFGFVDSILEIIRTEGLEVQVSTDFPIYWMFPSGEVASSNMPPTFTVKTNI